MLLLITAVVWLVYTLYLVFVLKWWEIIIVWMFSLLPFIMLLPDDPIGHVLMTESLTYPLFYIFMAALIRGIVWHKRRYIVYAVLWAMLMAWIRPQMQFTFAVAGFAFVYLVFVEKFGKKDSKDYQKKLITNWLVQICICFLGIVIAMQILAGMTTTYEKVFFDAPALNYSDQTLVQRLLYLADESDEQLFEEESIREVFTETWVRMQEQKTSQQFYDNDWKNWKVFAAFGGNSYILGDVIREQLADTGELSNEVIGQEEQVAAISHELVMPLIKKYWPEHLKLTLQLLPKSFISTVLFHKTAVYNLILVATCLAYLFALVGSLMIFIKKDANRAVAEWMLLVVTASGVNALGCDLVLAGLQRYMAYTLGMTWIGLFLLVREFAKMIDRKKKGRSVE